MLRVFELYETVLQLQFMLTLPHYKMFYFIFAVINDYVKIRQNSYRNVLQHNSATTLVLVLHHLLSMFSFLIR